jgi:hypothetical protein
MQLEKSEEFVNLNTFITKIIPPENSNDLHQAWLKITKIQKSFLTREQKKPAEPLAFSYTTRNQAKLEIDKVKDAIKKKENNLKPTDQKVLSPLVLK